MNPLRLRKIILCVLVLFSLAGVLLLARPAYRLARTVLSGNAFPVTPHGFANDISRLNQTKVADVWNVPVDEENLEAQFAQLLQKAKAEGLRVSIAGAQHSMGGHTIYPGGLVINMLPYKKMSLDKERRILTVQSGAMWKDIIPVLDKDGFSIEVMQSNDSFSVGGSISVNCHGWQAGRPPISSTVESLRLMMADGTVRRLSRNENKELFSLVLGGYGLFGIILDVELRVVPNEAYKLEQYIVPIDRAIDTFLNKIEGRPDLQMFYARLNIVPGQLFNEAIINGFFKDQGTIPPLGEPRLAKLQWAVFRGSAEDDYGKKLRFSAETNLQPWIIGTRFSRNQLLNESVDIFANRSLDTTDIIHEYFVPRDRVLPFVNNIREIVQRHHPNLINVTARLVEEDRDTFLRYADRRMVAFVLLLVQDKTEEGEAGMQALTRELIDASLKNNGRYYLPYRLHATTEQFHKAYLNASQFFKLKKKYDPGELFQNQFYLTYGKN